MVCGVCKKGVGHCCSTSTLIDNHSMMKGVTSSITNILQAKPDKAKVAVFHLRNKEVKRSLKSSGTTLTGRTMLTQNNTGQDILTYKEKIQTTQMKVATRNNLLRKLVNTEHNNEDSHTEQPLEETSKLQMVNI